MNRRANMALLRSLGKDQGALAAIDMALLRSFSNWFMVPMHARSRRRLSMNRREPVAYIWRNPFRVGKIRRLQPRVASQARQPWAGGRNPVGIADYGTDAHWMGRSKTGGSSFASYHLFRVVIVLTSAATAFRDSWLISSQAHPACHKGRASVS
jgi:hypothetical protein